MSIAFGGLVSRLWKALRGPGNINNTALAATAAPSVLNEKNVAFTCARERHDGPSEPYSPVRPVIEISSF
jgi:hypothetical protein